MDALGEVSRQVGNKLFVQPVEMEWGGDAFDRAWVKLWWVGKGRHRQDEGGDEQAGPRECGRMLQKGACMSEILGSIPARERGAGGWSGC